MSKIELGKTYRTRDGREVMLFQILESPIRGPRAFGASMDAQGEWFANSWDAITGEYDKDGYCTDKDLIEVRPRIKREVWVNVYPRGTGGVTYVTKASADDYAEPGRIACVKLTIDCEEGTGL